MYQKFIDRLPGTPATHRWIRNSAICSLDTAIAVGAFVAASLTVLGVYGAASRGPLPLHIAGFGALAALCFVVFGTYRGAWRYTSLHDVVTLLKATASAVVLFTVAAFLLTRGQNIPRSVPVLTFMFMMSGLVGVRLSYRIVAERLIFASSRSARRGGLRRVLLLGLTDKAEGFIRSVRRNRELGFDIVGILDDSNINAGRSVQGVRVLGRLDDLGALVARMREHGQDIGEVVVTENAPGRKRLAQIVEQANACSLKVSRIPDLSEFASVTTETLIRPRPVEIGDLLERPEVASDTGEVAALVAGKVVLATGAGGSIGAELCRQIASFSPAKLVITDASEFLLYSLDTELRDAYPDLEIITRIVDVRDRRRVATIFAEFRPQIVVHAAALKHVPMMEQNPLEALKTNVLGTWNVADSALANSAASFIMISTDKVVNPTNVMGASKRAAESYCQALDVVSTKTRFKTVRFGNVLGSNGSVVPRFRKQIEEGGPVTVTHPNMMRFFMTIPEAVRLVLHACAHRETQNDARGKIMVLDMGKPVRIADLAERMIQLAGLRPGVDIEIVYSGLRPGEKLVEELFDPSETPSGRTEEGYMLASPRFADRKLLAESFKRIEDLARDEQVDRAMQLLMHLVPEFRPLPADTAAAADKTMAAARPAKIDAADAAQPKGSA